jgi:hypothetical protein
MVWGTDKGPLVKRTVFYAWEDDLPASTNRYLIEDALREALKKLKRDDTTKIEAAIDRATDNVAGAPVIANTILGKIDKAAVFVGDVSIINGQDNACSTANPNVLFELGYAFKALTESRILMVMNTAFGKPEILPFDVKDRRAITYSLSADADGKADAQAKRTAKTILADILAGHLRLIFTQTDETQTGGEQAKRKKYLQGLSDEIADNLNKLEQHLAEIDNFAGTEKVYGVHRLILPTWTTSIWTALNEQLIDVLETDPYTMASFHYSRLNELTKIWEALHALNITGPGSSSPDRQRLEKGQKFLTDFKSLASQIRANGNPIEGLLKSIS